MTLEQLVQQWRDEAGTIVERSAPWQSARDHTGGWATGLKQAALELEAWIAAAQPESSGVGRLWPENMSNPESSEPDTFGYYGPDQDVMRAALAEDAANLEALQSEPETSESGRDFAGRQNHPDEPYKNTDPYTRLPIETVRATMAAGSEPGLASEIASYLVELGEPDRGRAREFLRRAAAALAEIEQLRQRLRESEQAGVIIADVYRERDAWRSHCEAAQLRVAELENKLDGARMEWWTPESVAKAITPLKARIKQLELRWGEKMCLTCGGKNTTYYLAADLLVCWRCQTVSEPNPQPAQSEPAGKEPT